MISFKEKESLFIDITNQYRGVISRVCGIYMSSAAPFEDLYQETLINIWQGLDAFRGDSKISTWIYRTAINTCISWHRKNRRHSLHDNVNIDNTTIDIADPSTDSALQENIQHLRILIAQLGAIDRAIITMWLDECSYDEIAAVTGLSRINIGVRMHRIRHKLAQTFNND